jgi:hypothetical protein
MQAHGLSIEHCIEHRNEQRSTGGMACRPDFRSLPSNWSQ